MRKQYEDILKQFFHEHQTKTRADLRLTQAQMAGRLKMEPRSYSDLDRGINSCSALTLVCYLVYCCEDPIQFLSELHQVFKPLTNGQPRGTRLDSINEKLSYRQPERVAEIFVTDEKEAFPVCPRCKVSMEREFMSYCDRCGQKLDWRSFPRFAVIRTVHARKTKE